MCFLTFLACSTILLALASGSSRSSPSQYAASGTFASTGTLPPSGILASKSTLAPPAPDLSVYSTSKSQCCSMPAASAIFFSATCPQSPLAFTEPRKAVDNLTLVSRRLVVCSCRPFTMVEISEYAPLRLFSISVVACANLSRCSLIGFTNDSTSFFLAS